MCWHDLIRCIFSSAISSELCRSSHCSIDYIGEEQQVVPSLGCMTHSWKWAPFCSSQNSLQQSPQKALASRSRPYSLGTEQLVLLQCDLQSTMDSYEDVATSRAFRRKSTKISEWFVMAGGEEHTRSSGLGSRPTACMEAKHRGGSVVGRPYMTHGRACRGLPWPLTKPLVHPVLYLTNTLGRAWVGGCK